MPAGSAVWGIDIGQCGLKALKLRAAPDGKVEVVAFDLIEHPKILSQPDADPEELIRGALDKFVSRNDWQSDQFVIGVPGQQTFARFCRMPPVDPKKVPDLVRFEASQQIPFDMDDVVWDYQTFATPDSPDLEVGIFAMRKDLIRKHIDYFARLGITTAVVQTIPAALYNFCRFDRQEEVEKGTALVVINVGAQNTDLVIVEPNSAWMRNIPLGGNSFTEALVRSFKLSFAKAESLKRTAATSKYARQIFQAMRPVFAELVAEIQRSIGFYSSTHRDVELKRVLALGNAFRLPGLQKYLENNLTISGGVLKPERFSRMAASATINAPQFTENILTFAAAYGLALQGLGLAQINANLLPSELARVVLWKKKQLYFVATAACLALAGVLPWTRNFLDRQALASAQAAEAQKVTKQIIQEAQRLKTEFEKVKSNTADKDASIKQLIELQQDKALVPQVLALVYEAMPPASLPLADVKTPADLKRAVESKKQPRTQRRQLLIDSLGIEYKEDLATADITVASTGGMRSAGPQAGAGMMVFEATGPIGARGPAGPSTPTSTEGAGFTVHVSARLLYGESQSDVSRFFTSEYFPNLRQRFAQANLGFYIPEDDPKDKTKVYLHMSPAPRQLGAAQSSTVARGGLDVMTSMGPPGGLGAPTAQTPANMDPVTGEDMSTDWVVEYAFKIKKGEKPAAAGKKEGG